MHAHTESMLAHKWISPYLSYYYDLKLNSI